VSDYPDFVARFYDPVYAQVRDGVDSAFYLRKMEQARGPVLEIGVGTGRLFGEARCRGVDVYGIDRSAAMIARCQAKLPEAERSRVLVADAVRMRLERRFALIVAPFRVLSHVVSTDDQLRFLNAAYDHLEPGGTFIFDLYVPNLRILLDGLAEQCDFDGEHAPGRRLRRFVAARPADLARQANQVQMRFVWDEEGGERHASWEFEMRFYFRFEIEHLVALSKLQLVSIHGDLEEGPLTADSQEYVVVCHRARNRGHETASSSLSS
jgi:SAM-dependent methyltransferase